MKRLGVGILLASMASMVSMAAVRDYTMTVGDHTVPAGITILDEKYLDFDAIDGVPFHEISDVTYLSDRQELVLVSDKGALFRFRAQFDRRMTLSPLHGYWLTHPDGTRLSKREHDSEGLTHDRTGDLYVSYEHLPRVTPLTRAGRVGAPLPLPHHLGSSRVYRSSNTELESIAWHPKYGMIVAKERPSKGTKTTDQAVYSLEGSVWKFRTEPLPKNSITSLEVMDDGTLLVLERSFDTHNLRIVITLKKVYLDTTQHGKCRTKILASLRSNEGWLLDNFEGLARVAPHRYVMVSDDGDHFYEKTLLIYFEVTR